MNRYLWTPRLRQIAWSVYGRFVWDAQHSPTHDALVEYIGESIKSRLMTSHDRVFDAGCGTGCYSIALARAGLDVLAVDYAEGMLRNAHKAAARERLANLSFEKVSLDDPLPYENGTFHHAIAISVIQAVTSPSESLNELARVIKPGGTVVAVHFTGRETNATATRSRSILPSWSTPLKRALAKAKAWAEDAGATRYWSELELRHLLEGAGLSTTIEPWGENAFVAFGKKSPGDPF